MIDTISPKSFEILIMEIQIELFIMILAVIFTAKGIHEEIQKNKM